MTTYNCLFTNSNLNSERRRYIIEQKAGGPFQYLCEARSAGSGLCACVAATHLINEYRLHGEGVSCGPRRGLAARRARPARGHLQRVPHTCTVARGAPLSSSSTTLHSYSELSPFIRSLTSTLTTLVRHSFM